MPGNEVGDRVHNFFARDNLSQSQHHSQVADGNWPVLNTNPWVGRHGQIDLLGSDQKNYNPQQSDLERGHDSHSLQVPHGLNSTHRTLRPELATSQSHHQHQDLDGYMYGRQIFQNRPDEANFLGLDTDSDRNNLIERGLSTYVPSQGSGLDHPTTSGRLEASESPVGFDFLGSQQQMSSQHHGIVQSLPHQQSGFSDMQQLQQQVMFRKMQELQRQKELQQLDARQQNSANQVTSFARQASGNQSHALFNGTQISNASNYPWVAEHTAGNINWLQRTSPAIQGSSNGVVFSPEQGQALRSMNFVHQQVDQSLYGVPISSSRGSSNQYPHIATDNPPQQMATCSNSFEGNQYAVLPEQVSMQDGTLISQQGFQGKDLFGHTSDQGLHCGINMEKLQQLNPLQRSVPVKKFQGRQGIVGPSEMLQDKASMQTASSQNSVGLDPTEEKILFGSDDGNIWDAFGTNADICGGASILDGTGFMNGLPSIQSGSWSALMQSAVAETSSSDVGLQEESAGVSFQNLDCPIGNHQPSTYNESRKSQTGVDDNNLQVSSAFSFRYVPPSGDTSLKNNYRSAQGFQQFGQKISQDHGQKLQDNSSQRPSPQSPAGGSKWLNRGNQSFGNDFHSMDANMNGNSISSHWTPQQSGSSQPSSKTKNLDATEPVPSRGDASFDINENENSMQTSQKNDQDRVMHEKVSHNDEVWKVNSRPDLAVELDQVRATMGSPQMSKEGSSLQNAAALPNSSNTRAREEISSYIQNSHHLNNWNHVDSSVKFRGSDHFGKSQHPLNRGAQLVKSSLHSSEKEEVKMHEMGNYNKRNLNESRSQVGGKQKSSNQAGRKTSGPRKFQYHPMGNLDEDVEPSNRMRQTTNSQAMSLHNSEIFKSQDQGFLEQSKLFSQVPQSATEMGKGQLSDCQGDTNKVLDHVPSRGTLPGYGNNVSVPFDRSVGMITSNKSSHSSQNMLELLHKVDQSKEHGKLMHFGSSDRNHLSRTTEAENSEGSGGRLQRSQSSASQSFGLQLAPPSQGLPVSNHVSMSPSRTFNSSFSTQATSDREMSHIKLGSTNLSQSLPSAHERSQGESKNNRHSIPGQTSGDASPHKMQGNFSSPFGSGFPCPKSQLQSQFMAKARGQGSMNQSIDVPFDKPAFPPKQDDYACNRLTGHFAETSLPPAAGASYDNNGTSSANISRPTAINHPRERATAAKISGGEVSSVSQPFTTTGISQQGTFPKISPNMWTNISAQQQPLGAQALQVQPRLSQSHQSDTVDSTSSALRNLEDNSKMRGIIPSELSASSLHSQGFVYGEEQPAKENPSNAASTQRDFEAFGRTLKPSNFQQNYSLLNQMQAMKNVETDPSNRDLKRLKGPSNILLAEEVASKSGPPNESNVMVEDAIVSSSTIPPRDPKMLSFSGTNASSSQIGNLHYQDMHLFIPNESQNNLRSNSTASIRVEHPKISPQMAPSWFNKYGTLMKGQMLQMYGAQKADIVKTAEQSFTLGKPSRSLHTLNSMDHVNPADDTNPIGNSGPNPIQVSLATEQFYSPQSLLPLENVGQQKVVALRPKKRKNATSELQPWHKEVSQGSRNLQSISIAEAEWSKSANRLSEKVEDDTDPTDDGLQMPRARRRLISTTQLMQQLFRAPPAPILSADASLNYGTMAYFGARLALGDASSLVSCLKSNSDMPHHEENFQADKCKTSDVIGDQHLSRVVEDLMGRANKLENEFLRLDKRASMLDLRVDAQDLEKFSVINRFAKFHGHQGPVDGAETSSSSNAAATAQRYVNAVPLPGNLPDRLQCLSL